MDGLKQQAAEKTGIAVGVLNLNKLDYSSFSDQEIAAMALNSSGNFSRDEQIQGEGWLAQRMGVSLEPYRDSTNLGDRRGHAMAINNLYSEMSPEVRDALNWDPAMMAANNQMLAGDESKFSPLDITEIRTNLGAAQAEGGLKFSDSTNSHTLQHSRKKATYPTDLTGGAGWVQKYEEMGQVKDSTVHAQSSALVDGQPA